MPRVKWSTVRLTKWSSTIGIRFVTTLHSCRWDKVPTSRQWVTELTSCYHEAFLTWGHNHNDIVLFYHDSPITRSHFMDPTDRAIKGFYCMYSAKSGSSAASPARPVWQYLSSPEGWRVITRRSENDNTPHPLDQWMNSSFMGQQVGNCKRFTLTHYLADLFAMHCGPSSIPPCIQRHIQLASPSFSESTLPFLRYSDFNILPWKSKVKVMGEVKAESYNMGPTFYRLTSLRSMSIAHPNSEIRLFQNQTLKIQGQGHGWGQCWKSRSGCNILSTHIPFVICQSTLPFLRYKILKFFDQFGL